MQRAGESGCHVSQHPVKDAVTTCSGVSGAKNRGAKHPLGSAVGSHESPCREHFRGIMKVENRWQLRNEDEVRKQHLWRRNCTVAHKSSFKELWRVQKCKCRERKAEVKEGGQERRPLRGHGSGCQRDRASDSPNSLIPNSKSTRGYSEVSLHYHPSPFPAF